MANSATGPPTSLSATNEPVGPGPAEPQPTPAPAHLHRQVGRALQIVGAGLVLGVVTGLVWAVIAPRVQLTIGPDGGPTTTEQALTAFFSSEVALAVCAIVAGAIMATAVRLRRGDLDVVDLIALSIGGVAGGLVAARTGIWAGGTPTSTGAGALPPGATVDAALRVTSWAFVLAWPITSVLVAMLAVLVAPAGNDRHLQP